MYDIYCGNNVTDRRKQIKKLKKSLKAKHKTAEVFEIDADEFTPKQLTELTGGRGLFEENYLVLLFHVISSEDGREIIEENTQALKDSDHLFVLITDDCGDVSDNLQDNARTVKEFTKKKESKEHKPWDFADAFGNRDRRVGWIELHKALQSPNNTPESVQGLLWWQTRMIWLAKRTDSANEADVSEYPYKKAKGFAKNFSDEELWQKTNRLVSMYHESHRGKFDLKDGLEQFILEV
jgi:DNA polymerase III gamma/tau subunit